MNSNDEGTNDEGSPKGRTSFLPPFLSSPPDSGKSVSGFGSTNSDDFPFSLHDYRCQH